MLRGQGGIRRKYRMFPPKFHRRLIATGASVSRLLSLHCRASPRRRSRPVGARPCIRLVIATTTILVVAIAARSRKGAPPDHGRCCAGERGGTRWPARAPLRGVTFFCAGVSVAAASRRRDCRGSRRRCRTSRRRCHTSRRHCRDSPHHCVTDHKE